MYITSSGIGRPIPGLTISPQSVRVGDKVLLSGPIGDHGITILLARGELDLEGELSSDTRSVLPLVEALSGAAAPGIRWMRDPTRGGVATSLNELARDCDLGVLVFEDQIPIRDTVRGACELLGLDPLHIANEGQFLAVVAPDCADAGLQALRNAPGGHEAVIIGENTRTAVRHCACHDGLRRNASGRYASGRSPSEDLLSRMLTSRSTLAGRVEEALLERNQLFKSFFSQEAQRLALACRDMSERFLQGGRLLAFGRGPYSTDAQHVSVEFVHPVIVGKRALPALDLSILFGPWLESIVHPEDIVMGFGPPDGDPDVQASLDAAHLRGAMTFALPGEGSYAFNAVTPDAFMHQEMIEILYHTLWETVHVFFERRELGHDVGDAAFLYPFLGQEKQETTGVIDEVADSIKVKVEEDANLRAQVAREESNEIANAALKIRDQVEQGGKLILFGNGGSATDANDWALDCISPPSGYRPIPAVSLSLEPANITALANDVGTEVIFLRQLIAQARPHDVAIGISTSGGSRNIIMALEEARKRDLLTVALLGYDGGEILRRGLADCALIVRSDYIPRIQEVQASIYHTLRELMETAGHAEN
jgi:D-sedoheptulose 7-phosphate isomerase